MSSPTDTPTSVCTKRCKLTEASINNIVLAVTKRIAEQTTAGEEAAEQIASPIAQSLAERTQEIQDRANDLAKPIQDGLLDRYGQALTDTNTAELSLPETGPSAATDKPSLTPGLGEDAVPTGTTPGPAKVEESPKPYTESSKPKIESGKYESECPKFDLCEPLRVWIANLLTQQQRNSLSATANPMVKYYERENDDKDKQKQKDKEVDTSIEISVDDPSPPVDIIADTVQEFE